jgi:hypothetical protein
VRGQASTNKRARGISGRGGGRTDRAGPAPEDMGTDRRAKASGRAGAKRYPGVWAVRSRSDGGRGSRGSEPCDQDRTGGNQTGETDVREAVPAVRAVRSESDGGDQTGEIDGCGQCRSSPRW